MKHFFLFFLLSLSLCGAAQQSRDVVSSSQTIVQQDTNYLLKNVIVTDNGYSLFDTSISYTFLGDSLTALTALFQFAEQRQLFVHAGVNRAFQINDVRRELTSISQAYQVITGSDNLQDAANQNYASLYGAGAIADPPLGIYRIVFAGESTKPMHAWCSSHQALTGSGKQMAREARI